MSRQSGSGDSIANHNVQNLSNHVWLLLFLTIVQNTRAQEIVTAIQLLSPVNLEKPVTYLSMLEHLRGQRIKTLV